MDFLSALTAVPRALSLLPTAWEWLRRKQLQVRIAAIRFQPLSHAGSAIYVKLQNWTQREQQVTVFVELSGETWVYRDANNQMATPAVVDPESSTEVFIPLTLRRKNGRRRPQVERILVVDALDRQRIASAKQIEALNNHILNEWPFPEDEWGLETGDVGTVQR